MKEVLKSDSICKSYAQMKKGSDLSDRRVHAIHHCHTVTCRALHTTDSVSLSELNCNDIVNSQTSYHATQTQFSQQGQLFNFPSVLPLLINGWMNGWTPAETQDRKCFSLQLILVTVSWIWSVRFARCYHFVASYCQLILLKKRLLTTSLSTVVTAKCACIRNTNVWFF